jgi:hypothetical protein
MFRRHHHPYAAGSGGWSIGSNGLTAAGRAELLKNLGRQLQMDYQGILEEPAPDRIRHLLERLERDRSQEEDELS